MDYIEDISKNWLALDGVWFQAVESAFDMKTAIEIDKKAWEKFAVIETKRIMRRFNIPKNGGIPALMKVLKFRVYANINIQEIIEVSENRCVFRMNNCRVQFARNQKGLPDFPCKEVGLIEYELLVKTVDPRIEAKCISCPPDAHPKEYYCAWEFALKD